MFALQYEIGLADGVANGNFGPATKSGLGTQANLSSGATDSSKHFVHLLHAALLFNGHNVAVTGTYGAATTTAVRAFQSFVALPITGKVDVATWGSLLVSTGDPDRQERQPTASARSHHSDSRLSQALATATLVATSLILQTSIQTSISKQGNWSEFLPLVSEYSRFSRPVEVKSNTSLTREDLKWELRQQMPPGLIEFPPVQLSISLWTSTPTLARYRTSLFLISREFTNGLQSWA